MAEAATKSQDQVPDISSEDITSAQYEDGTVRTFDKPKAYPFTATQPPLDISRTVQEQQVRGDAAQRELAERVTPLVQEKEALAKGSLVQLEQDRERIIRAQEATAYKPGDLPSWNAEAESAKHTTPPMEQFGSAGMIFAMLASAFTHQPMANALNAGAAAMKAIQEGDEKSYQRAYDAWKANTDLALRRHQLEREKVEDAMKLFDLDATKARTQLEVVAAQMGDEKMLTLLRNGMDETIQKVIEDRQNNYLKVQESIPKAEQQFEIWQTQKALQRAIKDGNLEEINKARQQLEDLTGEKIPLEKQLFDAGVDELRAKGMDTPENRLKLYGQINEAKQSGALEKILLQNQLKMEQDKQKAENARLIQEQKDKAAADRLDKTLGIRKEIVEEQIAGREAVTTAQIEGRSELEDKREAAAMERLKWNTSSRKELAQLSADSRKDIAEYLEGGRQERFAQALTEKDDLARLSDATRREIEKNREAAAKSREEFRQRKIDERARQSRENKIAIASQQLTEKAREADRAYEQKEEHFQSSETRKSEHDKEVLDERKRHDDFMQELGNRRELSTEQYRKAIEDHQKRLEEIRVKYQNKIDQGILNQLPNYPHLDAEHLGYIPVDAQRKIKASLESANQLEHIADYAIKHPESVGLVATALKDINLDAYQGLTSNPQAWSQKFNADLDAKTEQVAKRQGLTMSQAAEAKVLNKLLATQAFTDAAQFGARGGSIYLDRAFREIYQQASNLPTFLEILHQREYESDKLLGEYHMDLDSRSDVRTSFPFWTKGVTGTLGGSSTPTGIRRKGADGDYDFLGTDPSDKKQWQDKSLWKKVTP